MKDKKLIDIDEIGAEPLAEVPTSQGTVFVYGPEEISAGRWLELSKLPDPERGAQLLLEMTSLTPRQRISDGIKPMPASASAALTEEDVQRIASALRRALAERKADRLTVHDQRAGEPARMFFARVALAEMDAVGARNAARFQQAMKNLGGGPAGKIFRDIEASRERLAGTVASLGELSRPTVYENPFTDQMAREMRARQEDRQRVLLTSQATEESARLLGQLALAAEKVMLRLAAQDERVDKQTRTQLWVAIGTFAAGLLVAIVSAVYAGLSYYHDLVKDAGDDAAAKAAVAREERAGKALEQNAKLLQQHERLLQELRVAPAGASGATPSAPRK